MRVGSREVRVGWSGVAEDDRVGSRGVAVGGKRRRRKWLEE